MKLLCEGLDLSNAIIKVIKAISAKTPNDILECIKLTAKGDYLTLLATDTEIAIEKTIRAEVLEEGETLVPGKLFNELVKKLEDEQIELTVEGTNLKVRYGDSEGFIQTKDLEEYPVINKDIKDNSFTMSQKDFNELINMTAFSCSQDDGRPILKGCKIEVDETSVVCVALDGFRLAVCKKELAHSTGKFSAIVPSRTLIEITRLLEREDETVTVVIQKNMLMVEVASTVLVSRLLEGEYLNYKQIIPNEFLSVIRVSKNQMLSSIERAAIVARGMKNLVKFDIKEGNLNISASSELGKVDENLLINLEGKDLVIAFNSKYLTDILRAVNDDFVYMYFNSSISPCVIKSYQGDQYLYLLLPIRINA
ncbi:MAG: DNA polymerase III subunit beta [Candidatus Borkfalkiaceae bacterium]|nr:DNA polymerase III subunit beta [Christensenellaceae bacterium]